MKKIVFLSLVMLCSTIYLKAQQVEDDLYFVPSKEKKEKKEVAKKDDAVKQVTSTRTYTSSVNNIVVTDAKGKTRNVDEYNRQYTSRENEFSKKNDTLFVKEKSRPDLPGEWSGGEFKGSQSDYEYAERIIRFRNPRFAISVSSPLYWDVVYGANSWDWNVYSDGIYAYAFPTFSNPMWWNWQYNSFGYNWNYGWGRSYYGWGGGGYWGGGYWGGGGYWHGGGVYWGGGGVYWGGGGYYRSNVLYTDRRSPSRGNYYNDRSFGRTSDRGQSVRTGVYERTTGRVVGNRTGSERTGSSVRTDAYNSTRTGTYTRPSSTRTTVESVRGSSSRYSGGSQEPYGSSVRSSNRTSSNDVSNRSTINSSVNSNRSYSSGSTYSSGGSSRGGGSVRGSSRR